VRWLLDSQGTVDVGILNGLSGERSRGNLLLMERRAIAALVVIVSRGRDRSFKLGVQRLFTSLDWLHQVKHNLFQFALLFSLLNRTNVGIRL